MDPPKKSRIPTRVRINAEKSINKKKESSTTQKKAVERVQTQTFKSHTTTTTVTQNTSANLGIPLLRQRLLSDTALLPPRKKVKTAITRPMVDAVTRPPLRDLDKNIVNKNASVPNAQVKKNVRIVETVKNVDTATIRIQKKVEEVTKNSKKVINIKHRCETKTYHSKSTQLTTYKILQPILTSASNEPSTSNQGLPIKTPEHDKCFVVDRKNITVRRNLTPYPMAVVSEEDSDSDEIFVDSSQHFISYKLERNSCRSSIHHVNQNGCGYISPIIPNIYAAKSTVIFQGIPEKVRRPAKKTSLRHKTHPGSVQRNSTAYCLDIYNMEYLDDIVYYQLRNDWKYVLKMNLLVRNNPCSRQKRAAVVNWLIQAQDYFNLPPAVLFTTIRLFDRVLENVSIACNMYQLVGLVLTWIIHKYEDATNSLTASKMLAVCNGIYSNQDFLKMERKLLMFLNFNLKIPDVTVYVAFYLKKLKIESDLLLNCAFYIMECYALNIKFSTIPPSVQAAAAVCLALQILYPLSEVWQQLKETTAYYTEENLNDVMKEMVQQLHVIQDPTSEYREPHKKYATMDKIQASIVLLGKLVAS